MASSVDLVRLRQPNEIIRILPKDWQELRLYGADQTTAKNFGKVVDLIEKRVAVGAGGVASPQFAPFDFLLGRYFEVKCSVKANYIGISPAEHEYGVANDVIYAVFVQETSSSYSFVGYGSLRQWIALGIVERSSIMMDVSYPDGSFKSELGWRVNLVDVASNLL